LAPHLWIGFLSSFLFFFLSLKTFHGDEIIQNMKSELFSALVALRGLGAKSVLTQPSHTPVVTL
jgi:hypothetical protein